MTFERMKLLYIVGVIFLFLMAACQKDASKSNSTNSAATVKSEHHQFDKITDSIEAILKNKNINPRVVEEKLEDASVVRKGFYYNGDLMKMEVVRIYKKDIYRETFYFMKKQLVSAHMESELLMPNEKQKEVSEKRYYFRQERIFKAIHRQTQLNANQTANLNTIPFEEEVTNLDQVNREMQEKVASYSEVLGK